MDRNAATTERLRNLISKIETPQKRRTPLGASGRFGPPLCEAE